jgi:ABC-type branched-subunit amino acid transport system ATPase component
VIPPRLVIAGVVKSYGVIRALDGASLTRDGAGICGIIGPNGAGKTTLFDVISGRIDADEGSVRFEGEETLGWPPHALTRRGIARTFQECRVFSEKTCLENMLFALQAKGLAGTLFRMFGGRDGVPVGAEAECRHLLSLVALADRADLPAGALSYGQRRLLEIASALIGKPRLVLLDEPASGVNPALLDTLHDFILELRRTSDTLFLIVEHNMEFVMALSDHIVAMHQGAVLEEGSPQQIQSSPRVIDAYLG